MRSLLCIADEDNGEEEPSLPSSLVAAVERLEIEKERLETKNAELVEGKFC